ncbi:uncharacterized protein phf11 isoform 2-T2 [Pholidichthys leucotaenia]
MNKDEMSHGRKVSCILCQRSKETKVTGPLSTKQDVTAHQNCLLYSAGICCQNSPQFDDLFGFAVEDVRKEVKRGSKLQCSHCKKRGATAGCENGRCKRSYHYPCAVEAKASPYEEEDKGIYLLYCLKHFPQQDSNNSSLNRLGPSSTKHQTSRKPRKSGPSKYCLDCVNQIGAISLDSSTNSILMYHCDKHAPASHKRSSNAAQPSGQSSDSNLTSSVRRLSDKEQETPSLQKKRRVSYDNDSSDLDETQTSAPMDIFAPIESDLEESPNPFPQQQDAESDSLLLPVSICMDSESVSVQTESSLNVPWKLVKKEVSSAMGHPFDSPALYTNGSSDPQPDFTAPLSPEETKPLTDAGSPPCTLVPSTSSSAAPSIDSSSFWKSCNVVGCTEAIFTEFINGMKEISNRIQSDQASQEDYDRAFSVMKASGRLAEFVARQQEELQRKQMALERAAAAMKEVILALRK